MSGARRLRDPFYRDAAVLLFLIGLFVLVWRAFIRSVLVPAFEAEGLVYTLWINAAIMFGNESVLLAAVVGVWFGIVALWMIDTYKRPISFFPLLIGGLCVLFLGVPVSRFGELATLRSGGILLFFCLATVQVGGIGVVQYLRGGRAVPGRPNEPIELRKGPRLLFLGTALAVGTIIVDHHLTLATADAAGSTPTFWSTFYGALLLGMLYPFVRYDERRRVVQIGPGWSGKTSTIGGMYCDVKAGSRAPGESRTGRELVGKQLEGISDRLTTGQSFPDRTHKTGAIPFDYYDDRRLFRRKNVMMTFDYEGQKLTGEDGPAESFSGRLGKHRDRRDGGNLISNMREWIEHTLKQGTDPWYTEFTEESGDPEIAKLLDSADTVVFTLPLDDFLTPTFERGGTIPDEAGIYFVEPVECAEHERYAVRRPWGNSFEVVRSAEGAIVRSTDGDLSLDSVDGELPSRTSDAFETIDGLSFGAFEELPLAPRSQPADQDAPERRYTTDEERDSIETYLDEYQRLIELLWDRESRGWLDSPREFVWVMTMSDLVLEDFQEIYEDVQRTDSDASDANPGTTDTLEYLRENGLFERGEPAHSRRDYTLFGQWIVEECIQRHVMRFRENHPDEAESLPDVDDLIDRTGEDTVYPVWFNVDRRNDELIIDDTDGRLLRGANYLFDRIEGRPLPYPTYRRLKISPLEFAYQRVNPFINPTGKPLYDSAIEEMERNTDYGPDSKTEPVSASATSWHSEPGSREDRPD